MRKNLPSFDSELGTKRFSGVKSIVLGSIKLKCILPGIIIYQINRKFDLKMNFFKNIPFEKWAPQILRLHCEEKKVPRYKKKTRFISWNRSSKQKQKKYVVR